MNNLESQVAAMAQKSGVPQKYVSKLSPEMLDKLKSGDIKRVYDGALKDQFYWVANKAMPKKLELFAVPIGGDHKACNNPATIIAKTKVHTNYLQTRKIGNTADFWVFSIQITALAIGGSQGVVGSGDGLFTAARPATGDLPLVLANGVLNVKIGSKDYGYDNLDRYPSECVYSGFAGAGVAISNESILQNGNGIAKELTLGFVVEGEDANASSIEWDTGTNIIPAYEGSAFVRFEGVWVERV